MITTTEKIPDHVNGGGYIDVYWEIGDRFDDAGDGHCFYHFAKGESEKGHIYEGTAIMVDDQVDEIEDAEFIAMKQWLPRKDQ